MKLTSKSLIFLLIFSLVCSPVLAVQSKSVYTISKSNLEPYVKEAKQQGKARWFGFQRKNRTVSKRQGFFSKFNLRRQQGSKQKVQQKLHRQGFLSRFRLRPNSQKPKNQKRGFLQRFGIGRT